jgi:hypothetical protein
MHIDYMNMYVHILGVSVYVGRGKNTEQKIHLMPQLAAYNAASVAIDFIRMGCTTIKSSWP